MNDHLNPPPGYDIALQSLSGTRIPQGEGTPQPGSKRLSLISVESANRLVMGPSASEVVTVMTTDRKTSCKSMPFSVVVVPKVNKPKKSQKLKARFGLNLKFKKPQK